MFSFVNPEDDSVTTAQISRVVIDLADGTANVEYQQGRLKGGQFVPLGSAFVHYAQPVIVRDAAGVVMDEAWLENRLAAVSVPETLAEVKANAISSVKLIRKQTLDLFQKDSPGVARIYLANYDAATRFQAGDSTPMATGQTPEAYLAGLGAPMGMSAAQFAAYIIGENTRLGAPGQTPPSAYDVEAQYINAQVQVSSALDAGAVSAALESFRAFCAPVTGQ